MTNRTRSQKEAVGRQNVWGNLAGKARVAAEAAEAAEARFKESLEILLRNEPRLLLDGNMDLHHWFVHHVVNTLGWCEGDLNEFKVAFYRKRNEVSNVQP